MTFLAATRYWVNKIQNKFKLLRLGYQWKLDIFVPEVLFSPFYFVFRMLNDSGVKISSCYTKDTKEKKKKEHYHIQFPRNVYYCSKNRWHQKQMNNHYSWSEVCLIRTGCFWWQQCLLKIHHFSCNKMKLEETFSIACDTCIQAESQFNWSANGWSCEGLTTFLFLS